MANELIVNPSFKELEAQRVATMGSRVLPAKPLIRGLLLNGLGEVWADDIAPILGGKRSWGTKRTNLSVMALKVYEADLLADRLLTDHPQLRSRDGSANPDLTKLGDIILSIIEDYYDLERKGSGRSQRKTMIASQLRIEHKPAE